MLGKWWLGTRGTNPRPWDEWSWTELQGDVELLTLQRLSALAAMGQHVRLEFVPDSVAGTPDNME